MDTLKLQLQLSDSWVAQLLLFFKTEFKMQLLLYNKRRLTHTIIDLQYFLIFDFYFPLLEPHSAYTCSIFFPLLPTFQPLELLVLEKRGKAAFSAFISFQPEVVGISPECISMSFKLSGHLLNKFIWREGEGACAHTNSRTHACSHTVARYWNMCHSLSAPYVAQYRSEVQQVWMKIQPTIM